MITWVLSMYCESSLQLGGRPWSPMSDFISRGSIQHRKFCRHSSPSVYVFSAHSSQARRKVAIVLYPDVVSNARAVEGYNKTCAITTSPHRKGLKQLCPKLLPDKIMTDHGSFNLEPFYQTMFDLTMCLHDLNISCYKFWRSQLPSRSILLGTQHT